MATPIIRLPRGLQVLMAMLLVISMGLSLAARSEPAPAVSEQALKAALLLKLTRFVYLPDERETTQPVICILGRNPFGQHLQQLVDALPEARQPRLRPITHTEQAQGCDFVFIARSEARHLTRHLQQLANIPVATLSDIPTFARRGGMLELDIDPDADTSSQTRILINRQAANRQNIDFNAQLLKLATVIQS